MPWHHHVENLVSLIVTIEQAAEDPKTALIRLTVGIDMTHRRLELKGKDMAALEVCGVYVGA